MTMLVIFACLCLVALPSVTTTPPEDCMHMFHKQYRGRIAIQEQYFNDTEGFSGSFYFFADFSLGFFHLTPVNTPDIASVVMRMDSGERVIMYNNPGCRVDHLYNGSMPTCIPDGLEVIPDAMGNSVSFQRVAQYPHVNRFLELFVLAFFDGTTYRPRRIYKGPISGDPDAFRNWFFHSIKPTNLTADEVAKFYPDTTYCCNFYFA